MQLWGASAAKESAVEISAAGRMHWLLNACPQECHRSLSREPVVLTHHCRKSGMCMQEEMIEDVPLEKCQSTWLC
jgi:hypothetical protein